MIRYYPSHTHILNNYRRIAGHHAGMVESQLLLTTQRRGAPHLNVATNQMPHYERIVVADSANIQYHLSGYGTYREESFVKLFGESIERYALLMAAQQWTDKIVYRSYSEMAQEHDVVPWELLVPYADEDFDLLERTTVVRRSTPDDIIGWMECPSLVNPGEKVWTPVQLLSIGYKPREDLGEKAFIASFSKGSAAHVSYEKALESAILESVEADAFMLHWYTDRKARELQIDDLDFMRFADKTFGETPYDLRLFDLSMEDTHGYVIGALLTNRQSGHPQYLMGASANLDPVQAAYRASCEAATIHFLASNGPLLSGEDFILEEADFMNLDSNVAFWARTGNEDTKKRVLDGFHEGQNALTALPSLRRDDEKTALGEILEPIGKMSKYSICLDITPLEAEGTGVKVMRVLIPELVQLSHPGCPYTKHPRLLAHGGVTNRVPHPMP